MTAHTEHCWCLLRYHHERYIIGKRERKKKLAEQKTERDRARKSGALEIQSDGMVRGVKNEETF